MTATTKVLEESIKYHSKKYWQDHDPEISDEAFDSLVEQLPADHQLRNKLQTAGTVQHAVPILSLAKFYEPEEIIAWARSVARSPEELFALNDKLDGLSAIRKGDKLLSRGDGFTGEDWSLKLPGITVAAPPGARGEIFLTKTDFTEQKHLITKLMVREYKTPRSAVSGIMNSSGPIPDGIKGLLMFVSHDTNSIGYTVAELEELDWPARIQQAKDNDIPTDGLVLRLADKDYADSLGATSHHPRGIMALKFKNPSARTKLIDIIWQVGKRKLTPVAILEPVEISGYIQDKASLHNVAQINRLGLTMGATVEIERCGDIIPQIVRAVKGTYTSIVIPTECPACGSRLSNDGQDLRCSNEHCGGTLACKLRDSLVRLGVENVGPSVSSDLVVAGYTDFTQVFEMQVGDWVALPGFAIGSATKMFKQLVNVVAAPIEDYKILAAMAIDGVGLTLSKRICNALSPAIALAGDLIKIEGVGPVTADKVAKEFDMGLWMWAVGAMTIVPTQGLADRKSICFSGKSYIPRSEWIKLAEKKGYVYKGAVTKDLDLLVLADLESTSSKSVKAVKYGVARLTYTEFSAMEVV